MTTGPVEALPTPSLIVGLRLSGKKAAVFGSGQSAASRAVFALDAGADVVMYAPSTLSSLSKWVESGRLTLVSPTKYSSSDMSAFSVAFVADAAPADQHTVAYDAQAAGVPVNVAGSAALSDFALMPTYRGSSSLQIAVTTNGVAPRVASRLLQEIVNKLPNDLEPQLTDVARLSRIALEAARQRDEALAKLDTTPAGSDSGDISLSLADISTAVTATQTPESPLSSSGSVTEEAVPASMLGLDELRAGTAQLELTTDVQVASSYVAHALSDLCFVYSSPEQELGEAALVWSRRAEKNAYGEWASALRMETRAGAGHALWGALSSGSRVSAIASAASLPYMLPVLSELVARSQSVVVHAAAQSLDHIATAQTDFSDALVALQSHAVFLVSTSAQEAHDIALIAHAVSQAASVPVVHLTNGAQSASEGMSVRMASHSHLIAYVDAVVTAARKLNTSPADTIQLAFSQFKSAFGRTYCSFEYSGSPVAETVFVSLGEVASRTQALLPKLLSESDTGVLSVRALRPWSLSEFMSRLPSTTKQLVILSALGDCDGSPDALFTDVSLSALVGWSAVPIEVLGRNVYGIDERAFTNAVREVCGLQALPAEDEAVVSTDGLEQQQQQASVPLLATSAPLASFANVHAIAQRLAFPEAFETQLAARPGEKTFDVKVSSLYRMTPDTYDRNIFHIEFDTRGTDLTYEIGDALGVYGHNDPDQVSHFCKLLGLDGSQLVTAVKDEQCQTRSIHSWLTHALDLFGRPSKKFYAALAEFATDEKEAEKLRWLTTAEGSAEFKERVSDTTTYADLLLEFASARPSFLYLVDMVAPVKPRHYSIASSAKMHPGSVHLCVVSVEWKTSRGELRSGQCTRFLNSLSIGDRVVVSVKPSVMKLPPIDSQPVIMAGLGTGMAPFRAFIEERAVRKMQGANVGPMTLYFGSRHRAMEYLYGEELEAYHADGLLTNLRLAFSRDQKEKVYIQHRMRDDSELLASQMLAQDGCFYLCGPTWPAGDVKDAMVGAFTTIGGVKPSDANKVIETLKESERYILEVY
ncbi:sulfite reductase [NADPH] flavoprotein component [Coemansia pectinata]|uniref:Sulfite reductase [NADPH] flavoprotein component n=1 Tax=Coemansia pectinata TaxID=1052879 RepID=A0A9W8H3T8_9FUNG|nr:sulfite reductase [NADPH] flavoprotein component [Coemansia pectinata]